MKIKIGYVLAKPVQTQAQCDAYTAMVEAINAHNTGCSVGDTLWGIADNPDCYEVTDGGAKPDPADLPEPEPTLKEQLEALKAAQADTDAMTVDQEYRIALLELGITDETT
nr:MAG TPA: hypothetical protein [Caudoviricetes sp.]